MKTALKRILKKKKVNVLSAIAQGPAPVPGPSDEKLDYDDATLRGERVTLSTPLILHLIVFYTLYLFGKF